jgi:bla regulator protein blaR1
MIEMLANHLWQSTLFAATAGLLTLTLRRNRAQVRYGLWLGASVKFLIPLAPLVVIGSRVGWRSSGAIAQTGATLFVDAMSEPFSQPAFHATLAPAGVWAGLVAAVPAVLLAIWFCGAAAVLAGWWMRWRRVAAEVRAASPVESGRELDALRRLEQIGQIGGTRKPLALASSTGSLEPGVFGILRPVLLWPRSIGDHLGDAQVDAILAHELAHARRRDNMTAAVHMLVQALFWFHPLVWWLGSRLVEERERACDEEVIRLGSEPQIYAEGILRVCERYVESPLVCVAGVTGSNLTQRIELIMKDDTGAMLNGWRKLLLATAGVLAIAGPIVAGVLNAPRLRAQSPATGAGPAFKTVSVRANLSDDSQSYPWEMANGRFVVRNIRLGNLIANMYGVQGVRMQGGPAWLETDRFDIEAQAEGNPSSQQMRSMVKRLLADTFMLSVHTETQQQPVYTLLLARSDGAFGPMLRLSACTGKTDMPPGPRDPGNPPPLSCGGFQSRPGRLSARWLTMTEVANFGLAPILGRQVTDGTGLSGKYDLDAEWIRDTRPPGPQAFGVGPTTFVALEEQLGLKLIEQTGLVDVLVIDRAERPIEK